MSSTGSKRFFITGAGSGFGLAFAKAALEAGHSTIGTVRKQESIGAFESLAPGRAAAIVLDVTDFDTIEEKIADAEEVIGPIDVLVNNAGYGHEGAMEESSLEDMRHQLDVNLFGAVALIKAVLPFMRKRRSGHIVNITSMAGLVGLPGISYYAASKFALEGISEALAKELSPFGIKVTAVAPGSFRTDWAGRSMVRSNRSIADYDAVFDPIRKARQDKNGRQPGDPQKAARALLEIIASNDPPVHLLLGSDALQLVRAKIKSLEQDMERWEALSRSTDF
jgi:NAD(P)-dependent dehydrogenase (short-subunit alcohol dehydrogenase family)